MNPEGMSEQQEVVESLPRQLLSPLNYSEFGNYSSFLPLSPQYSSGSDMSLWDFSDCINGHSTGDTQSPNDHSSFQESFGNCDKRTWISPIQGQTTLDDSEPSHMFDRNIERRVLLIMKKSSDRITLEDLQQHVGLPLNDAAERLGISRSTMKRLCRRHDIPRWPSHDKKRTNSEQNIEHVNRSVQEAKREAPQYVQHETQVGGNPIDNIDTLEKIRTSYPRRAKDRVLESINTIPPGSCQPGNQVVACCPSTNSNTRVAAMQGLRKITIKARYMDDIIKFPLSTSSGIAELQNEVIKRINLRTGTFTIKYLDSDHDWVLIACDEDLQACLSTCTRVIQMSIQSNRLRSLSRRRH